MSGGQLVVLDRAGRDGKRFPLAEGLATLGCDPACDIRIMLPTVSPHHATVVVHTNQTVIRNVCADETLVNGRAVSVAALRHRDVISIGGRHLRWEYAEPAAARPQAPEPALCVPVRRARGSRRASGPAPARARDPQLRLQLELAHRSSMPGSAGGKQVAIVQPQRRDTSDQIDKNPPRTPQQANKRARTSKSDLDTSVTEAEQEKTKRKSASGASPLRPLASLQPTTKATLWIESRKTSPRKHKHSRATSSARKATPLRLTVLKRAQSATKMRVTKIEGPLKIDHTKQAAIRLMTGHTPKSKSSSPSFVVKKPSPVRRTRNSRATAADTRATPASPATPANTSSRRSGANRTVTIFEITDSDGRNSSLRSSTASRRSGQRSPKKSFGSISPRKSSLKDPSAKRGTRKTESIKFDLSNLELPARDSDAHMARASSSADSSHVTLHYSPSPPAARRALHSRGARMLHSSLGLSPPPPRAAAPPAPPPPRSPRAGRSSVLVQKALSDTGSDSYERRATKSLADLTPSTPETFTSPRSSRNALESYSIVDLVSIDTNESALSTSVYDSAGSTASVAFGTPQNSSSRKTRSTIEPTLLGSSTPYVKDRNLSRASTTRSRSDPSPKNLSKTSTSRDLSKASINNTQSTIKGSRSRRSKSLSTPENTEDTKKHISVNSTRISRASRSRSRLNDSELLLLEDDDDSPRTSKRISTASKSARLSARTANDTELTPTHSFAQENGTCTPENTHSPEEASTPVLSIQTLLDSSQNSYASRKPTKKGRASFNTKRKTIGGVAGPKTRVGAKSKSLSFSARKTRLRLSSDSVEITNKNDESEIVTPKSAVKLVPEGVKNKHSTAKKPQSKRSIIDDLNESDIVKQLFNSPVKRKLSQSMTEFSRKQLFEDDAPAPPDASLLDHTDSYTPDLFVSPISTPTRSPSLEGIKRMFAKTTPQNDLRNVKGVKALLRTPRVRRSVKNDLTNVSGVKKIFAKSPKNRLSDVRVKQVFVSSPRNDLRRVTGVKSLFQGARTRKSPRNELDDLRGVKQLFNRKSPANDLRNVSGVKRTLRRQSPHNDLSDVRGVKRVFRRDKRNDLSDVSGVEELFNVSNYSSATASTRAESLFDQLVGKPQIRAVYSKTLTSKTVQKTKGPRAKSLHASLDQIAATDNNWLEQELNKRLQIKNYLDSLKSTSTSRANRSKSHTSKSLHASLDEVTDVDVLLDEQLNKEQQINKYLESMQSINNSKANKSKANKSTPNHSRLNKSKARVSKANVSRELQKLITDTVEGEAPLLKSRIRNSTIIQSNESDSERKKSASELYGAHTLPIKKRSLVEGGALLPLKKRAVVHSTPVKGRPDVTLDARESPIRAHDDTRAHRDTPITSTQLKKNTEVRAKSTRGTRANTEHLEADANVTVNLSKKTRGRSQVASPKATPASPAKEKAETPKKASPDKAKDANSVSTKNSTPAKSKRVSPSSAQKPRPTRARKTSPAKVQKASPAKTQKTSPAKTQKARPAEVQKTSPAKAQKSSPAKAQNASSAKTQNASSAKAQKKSPVKTRKASLAKGKKTTLVVSKKASPVKDKKVIPAKSKPVSPVKKASPTKPKKASSAKKPATPVPVKATRSRKNNVSTLESNTIKRRASLVVSKKSPIMSPKPRATRKRKEPETTIPQQSPKKGRATRKNTSVKDDKPKTPKSTRAKVQRATVVVAKPSPQLKPRARRGLAGHSQDTATGPRKTVTVQETKLESPKKSQARGKSSQTQAVQPKTRGRKTAVSESNDTAEIEKPQSVKRGRKTAEPAAKKTKIDIKEKSIEAKPVRSRGKKVEESVEPPPSTRARRGADTAAPALANTRKRKSDSEPENELPPKVRKSKPVAPAATKRAAASHSAAASANKQQDTAPPATLTRARNTAAVEPSPAKPVQKTRARKANIENVPANQITGKRKRAAVDASPVKERKTRATRGNIQPEGKPAGRSRRR
ncbi:hypothetical protein PYW08_009475 [Mythimna loreyi]|uniref:Uncharacterized protein n=1 Tax=Mythimna loreyi TaxID=667449 RepID=A0ACC2Q7U5_9NEOP|nr:hypothetical protein PYW08_009475 [Mythimna loreyi]